MVGGSSDTTRRERAGFDPGSHLGCPCCRRPCRAQLKVQRRKAERRARKEGLLFAATSVRNPVKNWT